MVYSVSALTKTFVEKYIKTIKSIILDITFC